MNVDVSTLITNGILIIRSQIYATLAVPFHKHASTLCIKLLRYGNISQSQKIQVVLFHFIDLVIVMIIYVRTAVTGNYVAVSGITERSCKTSRSITTSPALLRELSTLPPIFFPLIFIFRPDP